MSRHLIFPGLGYFYEVLAPGCNKAAAMQWLAEDCGATLANVVTFGDGRNDIEMLQEAGHTPFKLCLHFRCACPTC